MAFIWRLFAVFSVFQLIKGTEAGGLTCFDVVCPSQKYDKAVSCTVGKHERLFDVELKKELSNTECVGNLNYSVTENSIRVLKGCRAVFHVCTETNNPKTNTETVLCSSSGEYQQCKGDLSEREVIDYHLIEEYSTSKCVRDVTFGSVLDRLWVDEGCQGMFSIATIPECVDVTCSSSKHEGASCSLPPPYRGRQIYRANVTERISRNKCRDRPSRNYDEPDMNAVWVYNKCHVEMNVCTMPDAAECTVIKCAKDTENIKHCTVSVTDSTDKLFIFIAAEKIPPHCQEGINYGYEYGAVWVSGKCNGYFRICLIDKKPQLQAPVTQLSRPTQYYKDSGTTGHCQSNTCQNNGVCVNTIGGYRCKCPFDFFGNHCELNNGNCIHVECLSRPYGRTFCALLTSETPLTINHDEDNPNCIVGRTYGYHHSLQSIWVTYLCQGHFTLCSVPHYAECELHRCTQSVCPYKERENVIAVYPLYADTPDWNIQKQLFVIYQQIIKIGNEHSATLAKVCWNPGKVVCQQVNCSSESSLVEHCSLNHENLFKIRDVSITSVEPGSSCYERVNYGYTENAIWVSNGCSAVFSACDVINDKKRRRKNI